MELDTRVIDWCIGSESKKEKRKKRGKKRRKESSERSSDGKRYKSPSGAECVSECARRSLKIDC